MQLSSRSFQHNQRIPLRYAFCKPDVQNHVTLSENINPQFTWAGAPADTQSFVFICHDIDVPSQGDNVNQVGLEVPAELPRVDFYHWLLANIPAQVTQLNEGEYSHQVTAKGKQDSTTHHGAIQGVNDYTAWFNSDPDMAGLYYGYDGPCPPWNDSIIHRYVFTVYALNVASLDLAQGFTGADLLHAMRGHILDQAQMVGLFTLNPRLI